MAGDVNFASVSVLLHGEGVNGSTTFTDTSFPPKTITQVGGASISTAQFKYGTSSILNTTASYLVIPADASLNFGTGAFTIEFFARFTATGGDIYFFDKHGTGNGFRLELFSGSINFTIVSTTVFTHAWAPVTGQFYHMALVRNGTTVTLWIDGVSLASGTYSAAIDLSASGMRLGNFGGSGSFGLSGNFDEVRITNGVARYTAAFTPPAAAFLDYAGELAGVVTDGTGAFAARTVRAYRRDTGALAASTTSNASTGAYHMTCPSLSEVSIICLDDAAGTLEDDLVIRCTPA